MVSQLEQRLEQNLRFGPRLISLAERVLQLPLGFQLLALRHSLYWDVKDPAKRLTLINLVWGSGRSGLPLHEVNVPELVRQLRTLPSATLHVPSLPSPMTVYRGFAASNPAEALEKAMRVSWTPFKGVALLFALQGYATASVCPYIATASVRHEGVLAYFPPFTAQHLSELLVDPSALTGLSLEQINPDSPLWTPELLANSYPLGVDIATGEGVTRL